MTVEQDILFEVRGPLAVVTLNRPKALNALTTEMIRAFDPCLAAWAEDPSIAAVVVRGAGDRAFCAGGDIRAIYESGRGDGLAAADFFRAEYHLNWRVFHFPKPYIALIDGIVMGGGVGVSVHGSHRVATERTLFAMPETGIGLFPDVGGSYFLPRLPGRLGRYFGLVGARAKAADCCYAGITQSYLPSERLDALIEALAEADWGAGEGDLAGRVIDGFAAATEAPGLAEQRAAIDRCFAAGSIEEILTLLEAEGGDWAEKTHAALMRQSPTSLKLTWRQLEEGATRDFDASMVVEYRLSQACIAGHDFLEGIRAAVIDKDNAPVWDPATLAEVDDALVERHFASLGDRDLSLA